jgi:hypothetical protein
MRRAFVTLVVALLFAGPHPTRAGLTLEVSIDKIVQDDHISGTVKGLGDKGREAYKVVVYVKTDRWYIHPYDQGGEGKSFATIQGDGSWSIETVRREVAAAAIAAVVVRQESKAPAQTADVETIAHDGIVVRTLKGTTDYGKL